MEALKLDQSSLTEEQEIAKNRLKEFILNREKEIHFIALAGSGKTHTVRNLIRELNTMGKKPVMVSYTGRATSHLSKSGIDAYTCHSVLYKPVLDEDGDLISWENKSHDEIMSLCRDGIIVDEASMIPKEIHNTFSRLGVPLVYVGDDHQLPSISEDDFCVFDNQNITKLRLTKNLRINEGNEGLAKVVDMVRESGNIPRIKGNGVRYIKRKVLYDVDFHKENSYDLIICGTNNLRRKMNDIVRKSRGYNDELAEDGEQVICLKNTVINDRKIHNGELFIVKGKIPDNNNRSMYMLESLDSPGKKVNVKVADSSWINEETSKRDAVDKCVPFTFGYCITCHRSQGSSINKVLFVDQKVDFFIDQRKFRYTAVSRASDELHIVI